MSWSESDVVALIESDEEAMAILRVVGELDLPDWWVGAGFVRNRVWDALTGGTSESVRDVDVVYFDPLSATSERDSALEAAAARFLPEVPWEIRNQARMHIRNGEAPYTSSLHAISRWPETATCSAVTLATGQVRFAACHGLADLVGMVVRPSPAFDTPEGRARVRNRVAAKGWWKRWPTLLNAIPAD